MELQDRNIIQNLDSCLDFVPKYDILLRTEEGQEGLEPSICPATNWQLYPLSYWPE